MILEVTADQIEQLNDTDLRELVGRLCEREVRDRQHSTSAVTWGGHQNARDGGIDVRVSLPAGTTLSGYIPKVATGIQVKAQKMPRSAILAEMAPDGVLLTSIAELTEHGGAYIIVSSKGSLSDTAFKDRKAAMAEAATSLSPASSLTLDFYDRNRSRRGCISMLDWCHGCEKNSVFPCRAGARLKTGPVPRGPLRRHICWMTAYGS